MIFDLLVAPSISNDLLSLMFLYLSLDNGLPFNSDKMDFFLASIFLRRFSSIRSLRSSIKDLERPIHSTVCCSKFSPFLIILQQFGHWFSNQDIYELSPSILSMKTTGDAFTSAWLTSISQTTMDLKLLLLFEPSSILS